MGHTFNSCLTVRGTRQFLIHFCTGRLSVWVSERGATFITVPPPTFVRERKARSFNQPLNKWDVSNVTDMDAMFAFASSFNQPLNDWNVSNVHDMFVEATSFNHALHAPWYVVEQSESE